MVRPVEAAYGKVAGERRSVEELVTDHVRLVKRIINQLPRELARGVSEEDLISAGTVGLVEAAHRFDEKKGAKFATFAYRRIKGAVYDFLRQNDFLSKSARARLRKVKQHVQDFQNANNRKPSVRELARVAGMSEQAVLTALSYERWDHVSSLGSSVTDGEGGESGLASLIPSDTETPLSTLEWNERVEKLSKAIDELPEREKQVIVMYYYEELYVSEMARILDVSESRVSQLHTRALYNLSRKLEEL